MSNLPKSTSRHDFSSRLQMKSEGKSETCAWARVIVVKLIAMVAAVAMAAIGAVTAFGVNEAQAATTSGPQAQSWPHAGAPGTIQGYVYDDVQAPIENFNRILGDTAIPGVLINAYVVKKDGTVISDHNPDGTPKPFQVTTDKNGYYSFNFRPYMEAAYHHHGSGDQIKLALGDRVRVWPDPSNYHEGHALYGQTPKRINGGTRLTEIDTLTLSWLGLTNYVNGSISEFNMAFRPNTQTSNSPADWGSRNHAKHLAAAEPTNEHDIAHGLHADKGPYLCGNVYSDVTFRFDRWDGRGNRDIHSAPDKVVPGVRVVASTYAVDWLGRPTRILNTRYDYTDANGRYCIKWDDMSQVKDGIMHAERTLVTVEPPHTLAEANKQIQALKDKTHSHAYDGVKPLIQDAQNPDDLPQGFSAVGANGWYGGVHPVGTLLGLNGIGYTNADPLCVVRGSYCLPDLLWTSISDTAFYADGADLGLIPGEVEATYSRYSHEANTTPDVNISLHNTNPSDEGYQVVMVPQGQDPTQDKNWVAVSDPILRGKTTGAIHMPKLASGNYSLYLYSMKDGKPNFAQLHDVASYRVTDVKAHYLTSAQKQQAALTALSNGQAAENSVKAVAPGSHLYNAYEDMGDGKYKVIMAPLGTPLEQALTSGKVLDNNLNGRPTTPIPGENHSVQTPYTGSDDFTIARNTEPGNYDMIVVDSHGEEVDRQALTVTGPQLSLDKNVAKPGETVVASVKDLNPDHDYEVTFTPANGKTPVVVDVTNSNQDGTGVANIVIPSTNASQYEGQGTVTLTQKGTNKVFASAPLIVSNKKVYGPQIILPGFSSDSGAGYVTSATRFNDCGTLNTEQCAHKYGLEPGDHVYTVSAYGTPDLWIYAQNPRENTRESMFIPGGKNTDRYEWTYHIQYRSGDGSLVDKYKNAGDDVTHKWIDWADTNRFEVKTSSELNRYYVVTMTVKDKKTGLSDTKRFALNSQFLAESNYGIQWISPAAVLTKGEPVPANKYCVYKRPELKNPESWTPADRVSFSVSRNDRSPVWPKGLSITPSGCLTGTPTQTTRGEDWQDIFASDGKYDQDSGGTPNTIRVAVRDSVDTVAPTINGKTGADFATDVPNNGGITVTQGDSIPLKVTANDNMKLSHFTLTSDANHLLPEGENPQANPALSSDSSTPQRESAIDLSNISVASNKQPGVYPLTFTAVDGSNNVTQYTVNVTVQKRVTPPVFATGTPTNAQVGKEYSWNIPVSDADGIASVKVTEGQLPAGLHITPTKNGGYSITGTPTEHGNSTFTVTASDKNGAISHKQYTINVEGVPTPQWDAATNKESSTLEIPLGEANIDPHDHSAQPAVKPWYSVKVQPQNGYTPIYSVEKVSDNTGESTLPPGLTFNSKTGELGGVATQIDTKGTQYKFTADFGGNKVEKIVTIKVVDKTAPQVPTIRPVIVTVGKKLDVPFSAEDNSHEPVSFSHLSCVATQAGKNLGAAITGSDSEGYKVTSGVLMSSQIGDYTCNAVATDRSGNTTHVTFPVSVRPEGPRIFVEPNTQDVTTYGQVTPIKSIGVQVDEGATLNTSDCIAKLPRTIHYNATTMHFDGTVNDLVDTTYTCNLSATKDGKTTMTPLTINVKGPVSGPKRDSSGHFLVNGRVDKPIAQATPIAVKGGSVSITPQEQEKLTDKGLRFNSATGKIEGTPTKAGTVNVNLTGTISSGNAGTPAKTFTIPVKVTVDGASTISGIPQSATPSSQFTPTVNNAQKSHTYTVKLCSSADVDCNTPLVTAQSNNKGVFTPITIPSNAMGTVKVVASDSDRTPIAVDHSSISIQQFGVTKANGQPLSNSQQGGTLIDAKLKNPVPGARYTVTLCKKSDAQCAHPVATGVVDKNNVVTGLNIPVNGAAQADPHGRYVIRVAQNGVKTPVFTHDVTATATGVDLAHNAHANFTTTPTVPADGGQGTITVTLKDNRGNPVTGKAGNISASSTGLSGVHIGHFAEESNQPGVYTATAISSQKKAGRATISVTVDGKTVAQKQGGSNTITFTAGRVDAAHSTLTVTDAKGLPLVHNTATAGDHLTVTYTPKDANGNVANTDGPVVVTVPHVAQKVTLTRGNNGKWTGTVVVKKAGSNQVITSTVGGQVGPHAAPITVNPGKPTTHRANDAENGTQVTTISAPSGAVKVGDTNKVVTVNRLTDAYGNVVPVHNGDLTSLADGKKVPVVAHNNGSYTIAVPTKSEKNVPVQVQYKGENVGDPIVVPVTAKTSGVLDSGASHFSVTAPANTVADGHNAYTVKVKLVDRDGHPLVGAAPHVTVDGVKVNVSQASENSHGTYTVTITSTSAGNGTIKVSVNNTPITVASGSHDDIHFTAGMPSHATITGGKDHFVAGTPVAQGDAGRITVTDTNGNPVAQGSKVWVKVPGAQNPIAVTTDSHGQVNIPAFTPSSVSDNKIAVYPDNNGHADTSRELASKTVTIAPSAPSTVKWDKTPVSGIVGSPITIPYDKRPVVTDNQGNPIKNSNVKVQVPGKAEPVVVTTDNEGKVAIPTFTPAKPGDDKDNKIVITTPDGHELGHQDVHVSDLPQVVAPQSVAGNNDGITVVVTDDTPNGATITVKQGDKVIGTGTYDGAHKTVHIPYVSGYTPHDGTISATVSAPHKRTSPAVSGVINTNKPNTPQIGLDAAHKNTVTINNVKDGDSVTVCVVRKGSKDCTAIPSNKIHKNSQGSYTATVDTPLKDGDTVRVTVTNSLGNTTVANRTADFTAPNAPVVDATAGNKGDVITIHPAENGGSVDVNYMPTSGDKQHIHVDLAHPQAGTSGVGVTVSTVNGKPVVRIPLPSQVKNDTDISVAQTDASGNQSAVGTTHVNRRKPTEPTVEIPKSGTDSHASHVNITVDAGDTVSVCVLKKGATDCTPVDNGHVVKQSTTAGKDTYTATTPQLSDGDVVKVVATDPHSRVSTEKDATVNFAPPQAPQMILTPQKDGSVVVRVTPAAGADNQGKVTVTVDGKPVDIHKNSDGSYTYTVPADQRGDGSIPVSATVTDHVGKTSPATTEHIPAGRKPQSPVNVMANGQHVVVTVPQNAPQGAQVIVRKGGEIIGTGTYDGTHNTVTIPYDEGKAPANGDGLTVTVKDPLSHRESDPVRVVVDSQGPSAPRVDVIRKPDGSVVVTVTPADPHDVDGVPVVTVNGRDYPVTGGDSAHRVITLTPAQVGDGTSVDVTVRDHAGNKTVVTKQVPARIVTPAPSGAIAGGSKVVGSVDPLIPEGSTVTVRDSRGNAIGTGVVDGNHHFTVNYAPSKKPADGSTVSVSVTDKSNGVESSRVTVTVDAQAPQLTLDPSNGLKVSGTTEPGSHVTVTYHDVTGKVHTVNVPVDSHGNFALPLNSAAVDNSTITVTSTDAAGNETTRTVVVEAKKPSAPTIVLDPTHPDRVTGTADSGDKVTVCVKHTNIATPVCVSGEVDHNGHYDISIPGGLHDGDKVSVTVTNPQTGAHTTVERTVDFTAPHAPTNVAVSSDGTHISGDGEPGSKVTVTLPDGTVITGTVDSKGHFDISIPQGHEPEDGQKVSVTLTDASGSTSKPTVIVVDRHVDASGVIVSPRGDSVSGKTEPGSKVVVTDDRGKEIASGVARSDGSFTIPLKPALSDGQSVNVTITDSHGNTETIKVTYHKPVVPVRPSRKPVEHKPVKKAPVQPKTQRQLPATGAAVQAVAVLVFFSLISACGVFAVKKRSERNE